jgi:3-dehydroquinate synthase
MQTLGVELSERSYSIHVGAGLLSRFDLVLPFLARKQVAVVTNATVAPLFLEQLSGTFARAGIEIVRIILPDGEEHKNWSTLNTIFDAARAWLRTRLHASPSGAGGGDLMRARRHLSARRAAHPDSHDLLAQADSSVGARPRSTTAWQEYDRGLPSAEAVLATRTR